MKRHRAVFTIVKNERVMLPLWMKYYSRHFCLDDIYVLDNQTDDGSTGDLRCKCRVVRSDFAFDHYWLNRMVRAYQAELLLNYRYVLFAECDEFVFHRGGLGRYIDDFRGVSVRCNGFELQHVTGVEGDIDLDRPILGQRSFWYPNDEYCKTLLSSVPVGWGLGFHDCENPGVMDPELYLIHLHRFDYRIALEKNRERSEMRWSQPDVERRHGFQNRILGEEFDRWFERYREWNVIQSIPDEVRGSLAF